MDNIQTGPHCAGRSVYCSGPLAAAILSSQCDMEPEHSYDLRGRGGGAVTLDLSAFPSKSGLLFISNDAETVQRDL